MSDERRGLAIDLLLNQRQSVTQVARTLGGDISKATLYSIRRIFPQDQPNRAEEEGR